MFLSGVKIIAEKRYLSQMLDGSTYLEKTIIESLPFLNIAYEINGKAICVLAVYDGKPNKLFGSIQDMKTFACELLEVIDRFDGV